ncbi:MAG: Holliday junction branch migration DNA helicase RuvB [Chthonomonadales bacterium]|nr:Holliday junction branch migration DNA helicase RuvB [Chthonomonadales bacterium]
MDAAPRIVDPRPRPDDADETSLRPRRLAEFIGQPRLKENLSIAIEAAKGRAEPLDHILLYGPPGLGKTTLSFVCANEMDAPVRATSGPAIERPGDLAAILTNLEPGGILFIDEIHRLSRVVEEILYPAMEDFTLDLIIGKGPSARTMRLPLPRFTLIGATTRAGLVSAPLRDRFGMHCYFDFYPPEELATIVARSASILGVPTTSDGAMAIARRARGTPRVANRLLRRCRDYAQVRADGRVHAGTVDPTMAMLNIDELGLDEFDRRYLRAIATSYDGGPVGIETLAAALGEERDTIEDLSEPYLLQLGFLQRTPRGRCITRSGCEHIGEAFRSRPDDPRFQGTLFS